VAVTPAELLVEMQRRYRVAQDLPRVMVDAAKVSTSGLKNPRIRVGVARKADGVVVRVASNDPRMGARAAAGRIRPVVVKAVDKAIRRAVGA